MRVRLSADARDFLRTETIYLRQRSPTAAQHLLRMMRQAKIHLCAFPKMGPLADDGPVPSARRLVVGSYVLIYEVSPGTVDVTAIRHGRMQGSAPEADADFDYEAEPPRS